MLIDAVRSEMVRFWHNGTAMFWGLFFIPLSSLIIGIFWRSYLDDKIQVKTDAIPAQIIQASKTLNLGDTLTEKAAILAEPGLMAFFIVAAAAVFATDYRWETWRLIRAKNSRENLIIGKVLAIAILALVPLLSLLLAEGIGQLVSATIDSRKIELGFELKQFGATLLMIVVAWLRVCQFTMIALAAAVFTRSLAATLLIPLAIAIGTFMLQRMTGLFGWEPYDWATLLSFPTVGHELIQGALLGATHSAAILTKALLGILLWLAVPIGLTLWWFPQQDLSKE